jgi:hypothetical protein
VNAEKSILAAGMFYFVDGQLIRYLDAIALCITKFTLFL